MSLSVLEQYLLELINRARLDPLSEAALYGIDLNEGLDPGTLDGTQKQPLAPNDLLDLAADNHSSWMLQHNIFSHTGQGGSSPGDRMSAAGYVFSGAWTWGENIAWTGTTGTLNLFTAIEGQHEGLFLSPGHRENILNGSFREVGLAQVEGRFTHSNGITYNASMVTENFAKSGSSVFVTGVVINDTDNDLFYTPGEGMSGATISSGGSVANSSLAGGYALKLAAAPSARVTVNFASLNAVVDLDLSAGNVKLDLVDGNHLLVSGDLTIVSGVAQVSLLGSGNTNLTGDDNGNTLNGNRGDNELTGRAGADFLYGKLGNDRLFGGAGADTLDGGVGDDTLTGGTGDDYYVVDSAGDTVVEVALEGTDTVDTTLSSYTLGAHVEQLLMRSNAGANANGNDLANIIQSGAGADVLSGLGGNDVLLGGAGNDDLLGGGGNDVILGEDGNDTLSGGLGDDIMLGGAGNDTYLVDSVADIVFEDASAGTDTVETSLALYVQRANIENLTLTSDAGVTAMGNDLDNVIRSGAGADLLLGQGGSDTLFGGGDNDILLGHAGNDILIGEGGFDILLGGAGADEFVFEASWGGDAILDFENGTDRIDLTAAGLDFGALSLSQSNDATIISDTSGNYIYVANILVADIDETDFLF